MWFAAERKRAPDGSRRPLLTIVRVSSPCVLICRHGKSNPGIWAAANQPDGQITSDLQKSCQAPKSKIFPFAFYPNQFTDSRRPAHRGACARHERGAGCGGRGSVRRANASRTNDADAYGQVVWF